MRYLTAALGAMIALACADYATAPTSSLGPPPTTVNYRGLGNGARVHAVRWSSSDGQGHPQLRTTGTIGPNGGTLSIPGAGFTIVFPKGALARATTITITSNGDGYVGYDMLPHGLRFAVPVIVTQGLAGIENLTDALFCAYLAPGEDIAADGTAIAAEIEKSTTKYDARSAGDRAKAAVQIWTLNHFSRYILASD